MIDIKVEKRWRFGNKLTENQKQSDLYTKREEITKRESQDKHHERQEQTKHPEKTFTPIGYMKPTEENGFSLRVKGNAEW